MTTVTMPVRKLNKLIKDNKIIGENIDHEILNECGFFILKNSLPSILIEKYKKHYDEYKKSSFFNRTPYHLTEVKIDINHPLAKILAEDEFKKIVVTFFDGNVGLYNLRIVKKDKNDNLPVFLHQDIGYQYGMFNRYSLFIPLTTCNKNNGGLTFYPGTHKFGYLGDAGEIINDLLPEELVSVTPESVLGDVIIMDSCLWHMSGENHTDEDRIYYDILINSAEDTASKIIISGFNKGEYKFNYDQEVIFKNSRTQRLKSLYKLTNKD